MKTRGFSVCGEISGLSGRQKPHRTRLLCISGCHGILDGHTMVLQQRCLREEEKSCMQDCSAL